MLTQLTINNFAIVRQLDIELAKGMSVIIGETGAGKSIAIDALGLCFGQRVETSMVREGQERAEICATFQLESQNPAYHWLSEQELQDPDNPTECILRRIINADGRSKAFINSTPVSASQLKEIAHLQEIEQRISQALQLARKHQVKPEDLVEQHKKLKAELTALLDFSESEEMLIEQEKLAFEQMQATATALTASRQQSATRLAQNVTQSIKQLAMENAEFYVELNTDLDKVSANGADNVIFTLRSNLGQQPQPLAKIASGGELSRISLAIQVLTSDQSAIPTLIFDEVDVGISGKTASVVGKLLRQLSERCQVLCVTHLPQVACHGHHQFNVEKFTVDNKTETKMTALSQSERVPALARLLGGSEITELALANAQEMLDLVH
ncbi:TPA: DNA repair protein RecN [Haemophilus influenzae 10810]